MNISNLRSEILDEVTAILASDFQIDVVETKNVPHSGDPAITFPNLDGRKQGAKLINTCVLYIDIRRSTELNLKHRPKTVAKLYSAFVRAMTRCARYHNGHVRGIIGDRVMVIFDSENAFTNAVDCAISMNSVSSYVINKSFPYGEVKCGIGIDAGRMLATKTGIRRHGTEQASYRNLVWLGRPANVASKLTDLANKPADTAIVPIVCAAFKPMGFGLGITSDLNWRDFYPSDFVRQLSIDGATNIMQHSSPFFQHMFINETELTLRAETKPIPMTETVWKGFGSANPERKCVTENLFTRIDLDVSGYNGSVYSGDVIFKGFNP